MQKRRLFSEDEFQQRVRKTREAMLLCEAAGFDVVVVETVGIGQSEISVRSMVEGRMAFTRAYSETTSMPPVRKDRRIHFLSFFICAHFNKPFDLEKAYGCLTRFPGIRWPVAREPASSIRGAKTGPDSRQRATFLPPRPTCHANRPRDIR